MKLVIFSGTTEGRRLSRELARLGAEVTVCVATGYGREEQGEFPGITVLSGRMEPDEMARVVSGADLCVDATHPYAAQASQNIRAACEASGTPLLRLLREESSIPQGAEIFASASGAAEWLQNTQGNILLTTGAKELGVFAPLGGQRLYPRVLPLASSLASCEAAGVPGRNILALQGPFSRELNEALIRQYHIRYLVTKDGGRTGGFEEKAAAAQATGATLVLIRRPREDGLSYEAVLEKCREMMGCR